MDGCPGLRKLCAPCQKSTIYFTYIAWLNEEAKTQLLATRIARSHCCQRLMEQQAAVGKTKRIAGIQLAFWRSEVIIVISSPNMKYWSPVKQTTNTNIQNTLLHRKLPHPGRQFYFLLAIATKTVTA